MTQLIRSFHEEKHRVQAIELIRGLIDRVVLTPTSDAHGMTISLFGDLAGILNVA